MGVGFKMRSRRHSRSRRERFEMLVAKALGDLPAQFRNRLENIDVVVADWPTPRQLAEEGLRRTDLLGLYEGVPLTERGSDYGMVPPDKITIFRKPIEGKCHLDEEIEREIQVVVRHEIAHHLGMTDEELERIEG